MNSELKNKIKELRTKQSQVGRDAKLTIEAEIKELISKEIKRRFKDKIADWKVTHPKIKRFEIEIAPDEVKVLFFRYPSRQEVIVQESISVGDDGRQDLHKIAEQRAHECHLGGDIELKKVLDDMEIYPALSAFLLYNLIEAKKTNWVSC